jgi:hypothetical protein
MDSLRRLKRAAGALLYDWPRYRRAMHSGHWELMHNRDERISTDGRGVRCEWRFTSDLHIAKIFPSLGVKLMDAAFAQWPVIERDAPDAPRAAPQVSFVIGHRGLDRLPHLRATLRSIAGQRDVAVECIVVEQAARREIETQLPPWVRYLFTECATPYNRAATFNAGVAAARGDVVILHDNDIVVPADYAREVAARAAEGWQFIDIKRFLFHLDAGGALGSIMQNAQGGSIAATRAAYDAIGGFDDEFVGWGGEDNDFWDRAATTGRIYNHGYLPMKHLYHPPQQGKWTAEAPGVKRYQELERMPAEERIARLLRRR